MGHRIIGLMGPGETASVAECDRAYALGAGIAAAGWVLLTGGRAVGVMQAASRGAKAAGGLTLGILPDRGESQAFEVDIAVKTDMGGGRNWVNVLSSDAVVVCGLGLGTLSELALALKYGTPTVLVAPVPELMALLDLLLPNVAGPATLRVVPTPEEAIAALTEL